MQLKILPVSWLDNKAEPSSLEAGVTTEPAMFDFSHE